MPTRHPNSYTHSAPSSQSQSVFVERLTEYWETLNEFLSPELRLPSGGSPDPNISSLASTLLQLQRSVLQQFRLADSPRSSEREQEEKRRRSWILDPQAEPILVNNVPSARRSICGGSTSSQSVTSGDSTYSQSMTSSDSTSSQSMKNGDSTSSQSMTSGDSTPSQSVASGDRTFSQSVVSGDRTFSQSMTRGSLSDKRRNSCEPSTTSQTSSSKVSFAEVKSFQKPTSVSDDYGILERLLENIRFKISKAKWTRDLQEFVTDYSLNSAQFSIIHKSMLKASRGLGRRWMRDLSNSPQRPCWGIAGSKVMEAFGEREGTKFYAMGSALQSSQDIDVNVHTIYVIYDFDRMQVSVKAICSSIDEAMIASLGDDDDSEKDLC
ncbi:hypothetical protein PSACC_00364 [Paramicrosporidium saccamoebae]|uniref:Uncharacterized protein n=1 Tax=Paramicrosporidium saccamoebae TaxID=1246581 RepID=A0A2H9TQ75_9FUNG|nr:hypothetical protein PSACC_00364 [Paramicrosporidium saccamoebae]